MSDIQVFILHEAEGGGMEQTCIYSVHRTVGLLIKFNIVGIVYIVIIDASLAAQSFRAVLYKTGKAKPNLLYCTPPPHVVLVHHPS
jgi:hypothetical protein